MRKIVSMNDGYSLFFEKTKTDDINCVAFETGKHMSGQQIGNILNISRSAVSQSLQKSIKTVYYSIKRKNNISTIQIMSIMAKIFNIREEIEYKKFIRLFPENIRRNFYEEAKTEGYGN